MRISVIPEDAGYDYKASKAKVTLDGVDIRDCFTADEESGEAHCYARDDEGNLSIDPEAPDSVLTEIRRGEVAITFPGDD
jgi:hypothetical protein